MPDTPLLPEENRLNGVGGMASLVFEQEAEAKELSCLAKGDEYCNFDAM